jgi:hypothetical protein
MAALSRALLAADIDQRGQFPAPAIQLFEKSA